MRVYSIALDFCKTKKFKFEKGKNLFAIHFYFFIIWFLNMPLVDFMKRLKQEPKPFKPDDKVNLN